MVSQRLAVEHEHARLNLREQELKCSDVSIWLPKVSFCGCRETVQVSFQNPHGLSRIGKQLDPLASWAYGLSATVSQPGRLIRPTAPIAIQPSCLVESNVITPEFPHRHQRCRLDPNEEDLAIEWAAVANEWPQSPVTGFDLLEVFAEAPQKAI